MLCCIEILKSWWDLCYFMTRLSCDDCLCGALLSLQMLKYFAAFEVFFEENLPKLFLHFKSYSLTPDIYLIDW